MFYLLLQVRGGRERVEGRTRRGIMILSHSLIEI